MKKLFAISLLFISFFASAQTIKQKQVDGLPDSIKALRPETYYGVLYNGYNFSNLNDFSQSGSATWSASSGNISSSGGAGTFNYTLNLKDTTALQRWRIYIRFSPSDKTATSYGVGVGLRSTNGWTGVNAVGRIGLSTGVNSGKVILNGHSDNQELSVSSGTLSWSVGDSIVMIVERKVDSLIVSAYNQTTNSATISTTYAYSTTSSPFMPNTGTLSVFAFGGTQLIDSINVQSQAIKNGALAVIGDSKTQGYDASTVAGRYGQQLNSYFPSSIILAGGYDRTAEVQSRVQEIIRLHPKSTILNIGSNDIRTGVSSGTWQANYSSIVSQLEAAGISVYHIVPPETSIDVSALQTFVMANWPDNVIPVYQQMLPNISSYLNGDGVHPNQLGNDFITSTIVNSGKIERGQIPLQISSSSSSVTLEDGGVAFGASDHSVTSDAANLHWDNSNKKLLIGSNTGIYSSFKLEVGTSQKFTVAPDYAGNGDIPASSVMIASSLSDLSFFANSTTGGTGTLRGAYYNGSGATSAWEIANTTGGALGKLLLMKGGGYVGVSVTNPLARLHIAQGTTTVPALRINPGSLLSTITGDAHDGSFEYDGSHLNFIIGSTRYQIDQQGGGGSPGGSNTQFQYNNSGAFAGGANATYVNGVPTFQALNFGLQSVATSGGTTTLTVSSPYETMFTGTSNQAINLPNATTLAVGHRFRVTEIGTGNITVRDNGSNILNIFGNGYSNDVVLTDNSTTNGVWQFISHNPPISLTTTGTNGPASLNVATGELNIPDYSGGAVSWSGGVVGTAYSATSATIDGSALIWTFTGSSPATFTLPSYASFGNRVVFIKNIGSATLTIQRAGSDQIYTTSSVTSFTVSAGQSVAMATAANGLTNTWSTLFDPPSGYATLAGSNTFTGSNTFNQNVLVNNSVVITGEFLTDTYFRSKEIAAPTTPASTYGIWYVGTDSHPHFLNDGGTDYDLTTGGGGSMVYPGAGIPVSTGSAWGTSLTAPSGAIVGTSDAQTLTNKTLTTPIISSITNTGTLTLPTVTGTVMQYAEANISSNATWSPAGDARENYYDITAQAAAVTTISAPSGTPANHNTLLIRVTSDASNRAISGWNAIYRAGTNLALPTTTTASKTMYIKFIYNSAASKWDLISVLDGL